jgi:hypothetical protein
MSSDVHPLLRNAVVAVIWATLLVPLLAVAVAISTYAVRLGLHGELTTPRIGLDPQTQMLAILGVLAGLGLLYWLTARETFGDADVDEGTQSALETVDEAKDRLSDE